MGGQGARNLAQSVGRRIELVILDLIMPGMDGLEFLESMQAIRGDLPVIVQTAQGSIETVIKAMRAGADDFVVKPVSARTLADFDPESAEGQCADRRSEAPEQKGRRRPDASMISSPLRPPWPMSCASAAAAPNPIFPS